MSQSPPQRDQVKHTLGDVDRRLTLSYGGLILSLMLVVLLASGLYLKSVMDREENRLSTLLTQVLSDSISQVSFSGKYHARLLLEQIHANQPAIRYLLLSDQKGMILAHSNPSFNDTQVDTQTLAALRQVLVNGGEQAHYVIYQGEPIYSITLPYRGGYDNNVQGVIQVGLNTSERDQALYKGLLYIALLVLILLFIGISVAHRLGRFFGRPMRDLANDMAATLHAVPDLLLELDEQGQLHQVLAHQDEQLIASREELLGKTITEVMPAEATAGIMLTLEEAKAKGASHGHEIMLPLPRGESWFELSVARKESDNQHRRFIVLARNITDRHRDRQNLRLAASVFDNSREGILVTDANQCILRINPAFTRLTGYRESEVEGKNPRLLQSGHQSPEFYQQLWRTLNSKGQWQGEMMDRRKDGSLIPILLSISTVRDNNGVILNYVAVHTDISEIKKSEAKLEYQARHDPLTGLSNRLMLHLRLEHALKQARREQGRLALLMLDLDHFKDVNDSYGHLMGDMLLKEVARRLEQRTRGADTISRLGGDEFTILLESIHHEQDAALFADDIIHILSKPIQLPNGNEVVVGVTMGIALFPEHGDSEEQLLQGADSALYQAKSDGRGEFKFFSDSLTQAARERLTLESHLRHALAKGELQLHFQPQYPIDSHTPIGAEALLRWNSPQLGAVSPAQFIPIAEQSGLIDSIGDWVLVETCRQGMRWQAQGLAPITLAVNVSPRQFQREGFCARLAQILAESGFPPQQLELEITEGTLMSNEEQAIKILTGLRALDIRLAIDDFGTGYSSFAYLKRFPLDLLKIDKSFIDDIPRLSDDMAITATIIGMARTLRLKVLAEGVETQEQHAFLAQQGCDLIQGYLRSRPLPVDEFTRLLSEQ